MSHASGSPTARNLIDAAARKTGQKQLVLDMAGETYMIAVPGPPGAVFIDASSPDFFDQLEGEGGCDPVASRNVLPLAHTAAERGVELRAEGKLAAAYMHQRWALFVTVRFDQRPGVHATTANVRLIRQAIRNVTIRALGPSRNPDADEEERAAMAAYEDSLRRAEKAIASDAAVLAPQARAGIRESTPGDSTAPDWLAVHRLARMGGDETLRGEALAYLEAFAAQGAAGELAQAVIEEVAELDFAALLSTASLIAADANAPPSARELYERVRFGIISANDLHWMATALDIAFEHLGFLRMKATTAGGALGHRLSYVISAFLQVVGRDLAMVLVRLDGIEAALARAEALLARSMADWMCRTDGVWRVSARFRAAIHPLDGSLNAVEAASLDDVRQTAAAAGPILYYVNLPDGYVAWLVRRDGRIAFARLADVLSRLAAVLSLFPFFTGAAAERHIGGPLHGTAPGIEAKEALGALHHALLPDVICDALTDQGEKLVIITDPSLNAVPFCALRGQSGRFLVEDYEIELWPSVTAWLVLDGSARLPTWRRARRSAPVLPLVVGIGAFAPTVHAEGSQAEPALQHLPGAVDEANAIALMLGAAAIKDERATQEVLFQNGQGALSSI
jgi:hypothetical protein